MSASIHILKETRRLLLMAIKNLSEEQFFMIPEGFDNNIAWNLGHIISVQQRLTYGRSQREMDMPAELSAMFLPGTSPDDWTIQPNTTDLMAMVEAHIAHIERDYAIAGFFDGFREMKTSTGVLLRNIDESMVFNNFHEGLHLGTILSLRNFVVPAKT
ncbi:MAG: DinB family protein [Chloroflexota bacterium]